MIFGSDRKNDRISLLEGKKSCLKTIMVLKNLVQVVNATDL